MRFIMWSMIGDKASSPSKPLYPSPLPLPPPHPTPPRAPQGNGFQKAIFCKELIWPRCFQSITPDRPKARGIRRSFALYIYMNVLLFLIWARRPDLPSLKQRPNKQLTHPIIPKIYWASWALCKDVDLLLAFRSMYRVIYLSARPVAVFI